MNLKVTFASGVVATLPVRTTLKGKQWRGVVINGLSVLTDKLIKHNTIKPDDTIVSAVASRD